eukprot:TRINITY_DN8190_c0_g1_i1.p2 TRINITY_DN8190_c0_g1~~TRINITY_DN8190_c0_g1_i1.p2  ORF type:complete len:128 (+),score=10.49 TRINITY_DN8190_c0_g1_i1:244-627(+)
MAKKSQPLPRPMGEPALKPDVLLDLVTLLSLDFLDPFGHHLIVHRQQDEPRRPEQHVHVRIPSRGLLLQTIGSHLHGHAYGRAYEAEVLHHSMSVSTRINNLLVAAQAGFAACGRAVADREAAQRAL